MNSRGRWFAALVASAGMLAAAPWAMASALHATSAQVAAFADRAFVPAGSSIVATMNQPLTTKHSHPGDRFTATVMQPVLDASGRAAIPAGSQLSGHVIVAERGHGYYGASQIAMSIDGVTVDGAWTPLNGMVIYSQREVWRSGARSRERSQILPGAQIQVSLQQPARTAELLRAAPGYGVGGGPR